MLDVLAQDIVKSQIHEIRQSLKFDKRIGSSTAVMPVIFQNDTIIITSNLSSSKLHEILQ